MGAAPVNHYSYEEYIAFEQQSGQRYEFFCGELFAMAGTSDIHNEIVQNIAFSFRGYLRTQSGSCKIFTENVKLEIISREHYVYPDVFITCHEADQHLRQFKRNPILIAEVLSESTSAYDRHEKWQAYQQMESLYYYLLVSQHKVFVESYTRQSSKQWIYQSFTATDEWMDFALLGFRVKVADFYEQIAFPPGLFKA